MMSENQKTFESKSSEHVKDDVYSLASHRKKKKK